MCYPGFDSIVVNDTFSNKTPCIAHYYKIPLFNYFFPSVLLTSLKIFINDGGTYPCLILSNANPDATPSV